MKTYSLLQTSLESTIDRQALEEASVAVRSVARTDCAGIQRKLFGIVISHLEKSEALIFQEQLARRNFPTALVADDDLPVLEESFQVQRIEQSGEVLALTDSLGRVRERPVDELAFLAAGYFHRIECKTEWHERLEFGTGYKGMPQLVSEREYREDEELSFRIDFFFKSPPNRINAVLEDETAVFHEGKPLRLGDRTGLENLMRAMGNLLPPERLNSWLRDPAGGRIYPDFQCYENEIRWHFHRLASRA